uniref:GTP-binding protein n=1 Tax=Gongylonema pulchrum TaxID=637853 RepID=A0A183DAI9_9BILA
LEVQFNALTEKTLREVLKQTKSRRIKAKKERSFAL